MDSVLRRFTKAVDWVMATLMAFLLVAVMCQVFARYALRFSFAWSEELPVLVFVWLAYLGGVGALSQGKHLSVFFIREALPVKIQRVLICFGDILILGFLVFILVVGWQLSAGMGYLRFSALPLSRFWFFLAVPVGSLCMLPFVLRDLFRPGVMFIEDKVPDSEQPQQSLAG